MLDIKTMHVYLITTAIIYEPNLSASLPNVKLQIAVRRWAALPKTEALANRLVRATCIDFPCLGWEFPNTDTLANSTMQKKSIFQRMWARLIEKLEDISILNLPLQHFLIRMSSFSLSWLLWSPLRRNLRRNNLASLGIKVLKSRLGHSSVVSSLGRGEGYTA